MKTMQDYTQYCAAEQTRRAWKLGAPITIVKSKRTKETIFADDVIEFDNDTFTYVVPPTTQQMINWLREQGLFVAISIQSGEDYYVFKYELYVLRDNALYLWNMNIAKTYEQAVVSAINAALDYLEKLNYNK